MQQLNGLLLVDKPAGVTSHDVVARLRRILRQKTVGHTGTLDPLATGLMVVVLGDATKLSDYLMAEDKAYAVRVRLGVTTDSLDCTGQVLSEKPCDLHKSDIEGAVDSLAGEFEWPVPVFSAAKVDGKKLYEFGHAGKEVETPVKLMSFWDVQLDSAGPDFAEVRLACSKGSFIRTWAAQLGQRLGVGGIVQELRRLRVGSWQVSAALTLEALEDLVNSGEGLKGPAFIPMSQALPGLKAVMAGPKDVKLVGHGQIPRDIENRLIVEQKRAFELGKSVFVKVISDRGDLLAILAAEPGQGLKIKRVFRSFA